MDGPSELPRRWRDGGFTLIESLVAIVILGIAMAGGLAFYYNSTALYYRSLHTQQATLIADSEVEVIKGYSGCSAMPLTLDSGTQVSIGNLFGTRKVTWPTSLTCSTTEDPCASAVTTKSCSTTPRAVGVCVTWTEPGAVSRSVGLSTCVGP